MKPIKLEDLNPMGATFHLRSTGKEYRLRPVNLSDEKWLQETFGASLSSVFSEIKMLHIARIVFHQLEEEDKRDFLQREVKFINEEGVEIVQKKGGAELLFWLISGMEEKLEIFQALMQTIGISRSMMEDQVAESEEKKSLQSQPTGP